jgi:hypothetical protein
MVNDSSGRVSQLLFDEWTRQRVYNVAGEDVELYSKAIERLERMARRYLY